MFLFPLIFGVAPSIIWLLFFLKKDTHPEPRKIILKIFGLGMVVTLAAAFTEIGAERVIQLGTDLFDKEIFLSSVSSATYSFLALLLILLFALIEEVFKYVIVRNEVLKNPAFDEPADAMFYMIIAGLGFAAAENILVLFSLDNFFATQTVYVIMLRFLGATFLHALCSATIGYSLALSIYNRQKKTSLMFLGIGFATLLHAIYNFSIIKTQDNVFFILVPAVLLMHLALFISYAINKIKKEKSVCIIC